ncbi:MAG: hypothetical protein GXO27_03800 [Chlorobi bacterium]|nr:hypothetical protein [Chlorobiota bacterium]
MKVWKLLFGDPKSQDVSRKNGKATSASLKNGGVKKPAVRKKIELKKEQSLNFNKKKAPAPSSGSLRKPGISSNAPFKTTSSTLSAGKNQNQKNATPTNPITSKKSPSPISRPPIDPRHKAIVEVRMNSLVKEIEKLIHHPISAMLLYDLKTQQILSHITRIPLFQNMKYHNAKIKGLIKLLKDNPHIRVSDFALFHFGPYALDISFGSQYAVFVFLEADYINKGTALTIIHPRVREFLNHLDKLKL